MFEKSIEALWTVEFISNLQIFGSGVAIFETNRIFGGDSQYYYLGNFEVNHDGLVKAKVSVTHFSGAGFSIFGNRPKFNLELSGNLNIPVTELTGNVVGEPNLRMAVRLTWRENLP
jgi:hypothetical protein